MVTKNLPFKDYVMIVLGTAIYVASINLVIVPLNLYSGGFLGISQIIRTVLTNNFGFTFPFDIAGVINFTFNIPLFILAYKSISRNFVYGTFVSILTQLILFIIIPIPSTPLLDDILACILIGAAGSAMGCGMCLMAHASAGGIDILGMYATIKYKSMSVGKIGIYINAFVYLVCALLFDMQTTIYSILYTVFFGMIIDRIHLQNIELSVMIFTKKPDVAQVIIKDMHRGVTCWEGKGAYTQENVHVLVTVISKYELDSLKVLLRNKDPQAFIIVHEGLKVSGGFEKRLV